MYTLRKIPVARLKDIALRRSSWHHTSSHYNRTDFYIVSSSKAESYTLDELIERTRPIKKEVPKETVRKAAYLEWSGTRKHPKATEKTATGVVRGNWFYLPDGTKKSVTARGFYFLD